MAQYMAPTTISDETTKDTAVSDRRGDIVFGLVARMAGWLILLVMAGIIIVLVAGGWRALANFGPQFFTSTAWDPVTQHFGAATSIFGTLVTTLVALVFAVPFAFGVAFWLVEMAPPALARVIETAVQLLAAVPSIIFGMWGFFIVVPFMAHHVEPATKHMLGHVPGVGLLFSGAPYGTGLLTGGVVLALMVTPFICSVMSDVFTSIPAVLKVKCLWPWRHPVGSDAQGRRAMVTSGGDGRDHAGYRPCAGGDDGRDLRYRQCQPYGMVAVCARQYDRIADRAGIPRKPGRQPETVGAAGAWRDPDDHFVHYAGLLAHFPASRRCGIRKG